MGGFPFFDKTKRAGRCLFGAYYPRQNKEWRTSAFIDIGMHCLGCPASRNETVEQACLVHDQPVEELVEKLNAIIVANRK